MFKKIILLSVLILNFVFIQNAAFAQNQQAQKAYMDELQKKVESNWLTTISSEETSILAIFSPNKDTYKSAVISFTVNKNGSVSNVEIVRSSRDELFDKGVITAIYKAIPFATLAEGENSLNVQYFFSPIFTSASVLTDENLSAQSEKPLILQANTKSPKGENIVEVANIKTSLDYTEYANNLQEKINSNWNPKSFKKKRNATVNLNIDKDGTIEDIKIQKSSNKKKFDFEVMNSITKSVPLGTLPTSMESEDKNIQLNFSYEKTKHKNAPKKSVIASINPQNGYDKYIEQVEEIISQRLKDKSYFCKKDIIVEMNIDKTGKLVYAKIKNGSPKDNFIKKEFNRKTLLTLQKTSFPAIPNKIGVNNITINYRILTQRKRLFRNFICDYAWNFFRTGLESYCIQKSDNI